MPSSRGIFLTQGLNPCLKSLALAGGFFTTSATWEALHPTECHEMWPKNLKLKA